MKKITFFLQDQFVLIFLCAVSFYAFFYFYYSGQHLLYADAMSRLNIARKVVDNLNPGLAQLGNVWLPLPQLVLLPFVWNRFLWQSGIAGAITSMAAFIVGGVYIYKTAMLITRSIIASILSLSMYALNINILYLQTTAMSEALFLCTLSATLYYFLQWSKNNEKLYLIPAAFSLCLMTLVRYEGLAVLFSSVAMVFIMTLLRSRKYADAEGHTIIFATLAFFGFALWTLYLTVIFGDPFYWKNYYATAQATGGGVSVYSQAKPFLAAVWQYFTSFVWMVGVVPTFFTAIGLLVVAVLSIKNRTLAFIPLLMPLSIFLFMVLTLQRNTPIVQPDLTVDNLLSAETSLQTGFNVRYGLLLLPWAAVMSAFIFGSRFLLVKVGFFALFGLQLFAYFNQVYSPIYQIPARMYGKPYQSIVDYLGNNYDGGTILMSASSHEDQMFLLGIDYKNYIHEGAGKYWKETLDNPPKYARWIVLDYGHPQDQVAKHLKNSSALARDYTVVFHKEEVKIYKIKNKPYIDLTRR